MTGRLEVWKVGRWIILGMLFSNIPTVQLSAQVGHDPGASPYHDILLHSGPVFFVGHLGADRGTAGAGTSNALTFGARYEIPAGRSIHFQFTGAYLHGHLWRLKYPVSFHSVLAPDGSRVLPLSQPLNDWTLHPWISLGIGWIF